MKWIDGVVATYARDEFVVPRLVDIDVGSIRCYAHVVVIPLCRSNVRGHSEEIRCLVSLPHGNLV